MPQHAKALVLGVELEPAVEQSIRSRWEILRAVSLDDALRKLEVHGVFAIICQFPEGSENLPGFFSRLRRGAPGARLLVADQHLDLVEIVQAINDFQIDRFLNMPIDPQELLAQLENAHEQYEFNRLDFSTFRLGISEWNKRVLCVDDDGDILNYYRDTLSPRQNTSLEGISERRARRRAFGVERQENVLAPSGLFPLEVLTVSCGEAGVEAVRQAVADGRPFSAGFFDMKMPGGIDGLETIRRIREIDHQMRCAVVTAYTDRSLAEIQEVISDNADWIYLNKPFGEAELQQAASNLVHGWNQRRKVESIEKFSHKLKYLFYKQRYMYSVLDMETLVETVCLKTVFDLLGADGAMLFLAEGVDRRLKRVAAQGVGHDSDELSQGLADWANNQLEPAVLDAVQAPNGLREQLGRYQIRNALSVPLMGAGGLVGMVCVMLSIKSRKFSKEDLEIMVILADHMEGAIHNAWRINDLKQAPGLEVMSRRGF